MVLVLYDDKSRKATNTRKTNEKTGKREGGVDVWVTYVLL